MKWYGIREMFWKYIDDNLYGQTIYKSGNVIHAARTEPIIQHHTNKEQSFCDCFNHNLKWFKKIFISASCSIEIKCTHTPCNYLKLTKVK